MCTCCLSLQRTTKQGNAESLTIPVPPLRVSKLRLVFRPVSNDVVVVKGLEIEVCLEKPGKESYTGMQLKLSRFDNCHFLKIFCK